MVLSVIACGVEKVSPPQKGGIGEDRIMSGKIEKVVCGLPD
jgi:hypothetical protein